MAGSWRLSQPVLIDMGVVWSASITKNEINTYREPPQPMTRPPKHKQKRIKKNKETIF
ncbi:hypothetical protein HanPI659440_Chr11g0436331 [Helianthus annuus]|nr:hypothetical protein HanPI659440_Chr11g0436331 [Helianthus annuus]